MVRIAFLTLLVVVLVAGCGPPGRKVYNEAKTRTCLSQKGVSFLRRLDFVATTATGGAFKAKLSDNFVTVVFGATLDDADNINQAYQTFHSKNVGINDVLRQQGSAVMLWHVHPQDRDLALVQGCLSS